MKRLIQWWFWLFLLACLGLCAALMSGGGQPQIKPVKPAEIDRLQTDTFSTGLMLGWACCQRGGSQQDVVYLISCWTNGRPDLVRGWFETR